jgi:hypothetical protein
MDFELAKIPARVDNRKLRFNNLDNVVSFRRASPHRESLQFEMCGQSNPDVCERLLGDAGEKAN